MYDYIHKGRLVTIKPGAHEELIRRGWERTVEHNHNGHYGKIVFEFGKNMGDHHICIDFGSEEVGYPPEFIDYGPF